jgi:hypothetical protein
MRRTASTLITCWQQKKPAQDQARLPCRKSRATSIVEQILTESGLSQSTAEEVYLQLVDYLDGDTTTAKEGAEMMPGRRRACPSAC